VMREIYVAFKTLDLTDENRGKIGTKESCEQYIMEQLKRYPNTHWYIAEISNPSRVWEHREMKTQRIYMYTDSDEYKKMVSNDGTTQEEEPSDV